MNSERESDMEIELLNDFDIYQFTYITLIYLIGVALPFAASHYRDERPACFVGPLSLLFTHSIFLLSVRTISATPLCDVVTLWCCALLVPHKYLQSIFLCGLS